MLEQFTSRCRTTRIMQQLGGAFGAATLAMVWAIGVTVIAAVPALLLPRRRALE
jgi:hypothetical protein